MSTENKYEIARSIFDSLVKQGTIPEDHPREITFEESEKLELVFCVYLSEFYTLEELVFCEDVQDYVHENFSWHSDLGQCFYTDDEPRLWDWDNNTSGTEDEFQENDDFHWVMLGDARRHWVHYEDCVYCEDEDEYCLTDDATYSDSDGCWYWDSREANQGTDYINGYHSTPAPENLNTGENKSIFSIGFEIEKAHFISDEGNTAENRGDFVGACEMFKGYELDSSCGVEAISHILPLGNPRSKARKYVFKMFEEAHHIIEDSPSTLSCGGHITLSCSLPEYRTGVDLLDKVKHNLGIFYALYRGRLSNRYCSDNKDLKSVRGIKYSPVQVLSNRIEVRIPGAVRSVAQLKNRYDLCYKLMQYSIMKPCNFDILKNHVRPVLNRMYRDSESRVEMILEFSDKFREFLITGEQPEEIKEYLTNNN